MSQNPHFTTSLRDVCAQENLRSRPAKNKPAIESVGIIAGSLVVFCRWHVWHYPAAGTAEVWARHQGTQWRRLPDTQGRMESLGQQGVRQPSGHLPHGEALPHVHWGTYHLNTGSGEGVGKASRKARGVDQVNDWARPGRITYASRQDLGSLRLAGTFA